MIGSFFPTGLLDRSAEFFTPEECDVYSSEYNLDQAPFGGAEFNSSGTGLDTLRSSERRRRDLSSRAINITLLCECQEKSFESEFFPFLLLTAYSTERETDCYTWHDTKIVTLSRMRPSSVTASPGFSVSSNEAPVGFTAGRAVRCRGVPGGRRSPLRSKELLNYPAA